jgi:RNA polymerase sigma factor (sigma-70 family)
MERGYTLSSERQEQRPGDGKGADDGHAKAVKRLFEEHNRALVTFLTARLRSEQKARDVAQEAYVRMLQLDNHDAVSFLRAYLFKVAANLAVDRLRERAAREANQTLATVESMVDERMPDRTVIAEQQLEAVRAAILDLPVHVRRAFVWHVFGGQSTTRIGARLGITDRMVRLYVAQGLAACRARMEQ